MLDGVEVQNATSRARALTELGYSIADNLVSDVIILCEGPTDKPVIEEFLNKLGIGERFNIKVWPLGGDIMDQLDLSVFAESYRVVALVDADHQSGRIRARFLAKCSELGIPATKLERYSIENYFSTEAIASVMKTAIPVGVRQLSPDTPVREQLGFDVKRNGGQIAKVMSIADIEGTDLHQFLVKVGTLADEGATA
jgi:5S rRNA maturation endonuclease (ribonuclease M5)